MQTVPVELVQETWEQLVNAPPDSIQAMVAQMAEQQPAVLGYLMVADEEMAENARGQLLVLGTMIWQCFAAVGGDLPQIAEEELDAAEDANVQQLDQLSEGAEMNYMDAVRALLDEYNQLPLLQAVIEELMSDYADEPDLADEEIGIGLLYLKSVIDCFDGLNREQRE